MNIISLDYCISIYILLDFIRRWRRQYASFLLSLFIYFVTIIHFISVEKFEFWLDFITQIQMFRRRIDLVPLRELNKMQYIELNIWDTTYIVVLEKRGKNWNKSYNKNSRLWAATIGMWINDDWRREKIRWIVLIIVSNQM